DGAPGMPSDEYFRLITPDLQEFGIPDLSSEEGQAAVEALLSDGDLLVLDNLSTLCRGGKENEAQSWLPVQRWLLALRRRRLSVLSLHHASKGGAQRGTSRREDVLDTVIVLPPPDEYSPVDGAKFEVRFEKARTLCGEAAKPFEASMEIRDNAAIWST